MSMHPIYMNLLIYIYIYSIRRMSMHPIYMNLLKFSDFEPNFSLMSFVGGMNLSPIRYCPLRPKALSLNPQGFAQSHIRERCLPLIPYKPLA